MEKIKNGGPAFPVECDWIDGHPQGRQTANHAGWHEGMTLRDYFAAKAMQGFAACEEQYSNLDTMAKAAYIWADAMLRAREA
ncbi:hypothetical protein H3V53_06180 [Paraburkholderia bengalensis]|uniref:Uncharacterized protein n=1 Tax=Paraburkholderia bengalensis TaxID=2747562 RepID=A0ABU8IMH7_9BURK